MAKAIKLTFKTPLAPLRYLTTAGQGKMKYDPTNKLDKNDPASYEYTATAILTKAQKDVIEPILKNFWNENKPAGITKQKYTLLKEEMETTNEKDEDGDAIKKATGFWLLQAKTNAVWPSGDKNTIKIMRGNGSPLNLGEKRIGDESVGVLHGEIAINAFGGNEGLLFYLNGVQLRKFVEYTGGTIETEDLEGEDEGMDDLDMPAEPIETPNTPDV